MARPQLGEAAARPLAQLERRAALDNAAVAHDDDAVAVHDGVEAVGDGDDAHALRKARRARVSCSRARPAWESACSPGVRSSGAGYGPGLFEACVLTLTL